MAEAAKRCGTRFHKRQGESGPRPSPCSACSIGLPVGTNRRGDLPGAELIQQFTELHPWRHLRVKTLFASLPEIEEQRAAAASPTVNFMRVPAMSAGFMSARWRNRTGRSRIAKTKLLRGPRPARFKAGIRGTAKFGWAGDFVAAKSDTAFTTSPRSSRVLVFFAPAKPNRLRFSTRTRYRVSRLLAGIQ